VVARKGSVQLSGGREPAGGEDKWSPWDGRDGAEGTVREVSENGLAGGHATGVVHHEIWPRLM
jgi:hypothetical protein